MKTIRKLFSVVSFTAALASCDTTGTTDFDSSPLYSPTANFSVFWSQVGDAILDQDIERLLALSRSSSGAISFDRGYDAVYPLRDTCERRALIAYLEGSLEEPVLVATPPRSTPGPLTTRRAWGDVLRSSSAPVLRDNPAVTREGETDANPYYRYGHVRFGKNTVDDTWILTGFVHSGERMFSISSRAGGPSSC